MVKASGPILGPGPTGSRNRCRRAEDAFGQCRANTYDCRDFSTQFEAQAVYWACGGQQNDVHRLDRDRDGWACEPYPER